MAKTSHSTIAYHYVGFFARLWASIIDTLWISLFILVILFSIFGIDYLNMPDSEQGVMGSLLWWLLPAIMTIGFWFFRSASPGKILISAKIVDRKTGKKPDWWQIVARYVAYFISLLPFGFGFLWILWDDHKQGWHDKIASTLVIYDNSSKKQRKIKLWASIIGLIAILSSGYFFLGDTLSQAYKLSNSRSFSAYINDGFIFGEGMSSDACYQEMLWRVDHDCRDLYCKYGQLYFLKACLAASAAAPPNEASGSYA